MDVSKAFQALDGILTEATAKEDLKKLLADIEQLDQEIDDLRKEMNDEWTGNYVQRYKNEQEEFLHVSQELAKLRATYRTKYYTDWDDDGDPTDFDFHVDKKKEKEASIIEAMIEAKVKELEANFKKLKAQAEAEYSAAFATHSQSIKDKTTTRDTKKSTRKQAIRAAIEEERPELEKIIAKLQKTLKVEPAWDSAEVRGNKLIFTIIGPGGEYEVEYDEDFDRDEDGTSIDQGKIWDTIYDSIWEDGYLADFAAALDIDEVLIDAADAQTFFDIPGSDWKLSCDVEPVYDEPMIHNEYYSPATYWEPEEYDLEYDEYVNWKIEYTLFKEI